MAAMAAMSPAYSINLILEVIFIAIYLFPQKLGGSIKQRTTPILKILSVFSFVSALLVAKILSACRVRGNL